MPGNAAPAQPRARARQPRARQPRPRRRLREEPLSGRAMLEGALMLLGGRHATYTDEDAQRWRSVVRHLSAAVRERGCTARLPRCGTPERIEVWLEEMNAIIGQAGHVPDGKAFELVDLSGGSPTYTLLFCRRSYRFPPWVLALSDDEF